MNRPQAYDPSYNQQQPTQMFTFYNNNQQPPNQYAPQSEYPPPPPVYNPHNPGSPPAYLPPKDGPPMESSKIDYTQRSDLPSTHGEGASRFG